MKRFTWPSVSFAIATRNSERTISDCLTSIKKQDYPGKVEIVIADGGSLDRTLEIAKRNHTEILKVEENKQNAEYNKGVAVNACKNEILVMIDHDNILPHKNWLKNMVKPLLEDEQIFGVGVLKFEYNKKMNLLDRYFALFGATDPIPFFFNKSAHQSYLYEGFHLKGKLIKEERDYYKVELNPKRMPALGGNGAALRRKLLKLTKYLPDQFFHIDIHVDLAKKGYITYAFVKDTIIHLTNNKFVPFIRRRRYFMEKYHFEDQSRRRYSIYDPKQDKYVLLGFIIYSLSIILPLWDSVRGFLKIRDLAWFMHPLMCLSIFLIYSITTIREGVKHVFLERQVGINYRR